MTVFCNTQGYPSADEFTKLDATTAAGLKAGPWVLIVYYFFMEGERAYVFNTFKLPEEPTAINGLQADDEDGDTYDLSGRKVDTCWSVFMGVCLLSMIVMLCMVKWLERVTQ